MAFNDKEQQLIRWGIQNGKSREEIESAVAGLRAGVVPSAQPKAAATETETAPEESGMQLPSLDFLRPTRTTQEMESERQQTLLPETVKEEKTKEAITAGAAPISTNPLDFYQNNEKYFGVPIGEAGNIARGIAKQVGRGISGSASAQAARSAIESGVAGVKQAADAPVVGGVRQFISEVGERVPRFLGRAKEVVQESAARAERIKTATPAVREAIQVNLDDRIINTVEQADESTLKAYKEMVDIAESTTGKQGGTLQLAQRPEIVAGRAAEQQFDLIEKQRKTVGSQIGAAVDQLSKTTKIPIETPVFNMQVTLSRNGIEVGDAGKLVFTNTRFTPSERTKIQALYDLATEGGEQLTPRQIYNKDQLFSKLQRESRFEGVGDLIVETETGNNSLFRVFRDVFSKTLDDVSPEDIRALNSQYRKLVNLQDDIEGSIFKSGNFDTADRVAGAEFAKTNLRRLLSDAQSAPIYQAIAREMDVVARELGYEGANPEQLISFATGLRDVYGEVVPKTSMTGIIGGVRQAIEKTLEIGAPSNIDRQRALRGILDEALQTKSPQSSLSAEKVAAAAGAVPATEDENGEVQPEMAAAAALAGFMSGKSSLTPARKKAIQTQIQTLESSMKTLTSVGAKVARRKAIDVLRLMLR